MQERGLQAGGAAQRSPGPLALVSGEPHRLMFFFGAVQAVIAFGWWSAHVVSRYFAFGTPYAWSVPPMWAHAWLLLYGLFPFFMFGFLMTAGPNWLGAPKPSRAGFVPAAVGMAMGVVVFYIGLFTTREIAGTGLLLHAAGWIWGMGVLVRMVVRYWNANARYALVLFVFLSVGAAGSALFALAVASGSYGYARQALHGAIWFFILPIFVGVSTRMVPFFSSRILGPSADYRPWWARPALIVGVLAHGAMELYGASGVVWLVDLPLAFVVARLAWRWGLAQSFRVRLLAVLHISLAVLAAAFLLYAVLSLSVAAGVLERIGLAPVHLLTLGYFAAMTLGMVSRVSLGHSGRPLEADSWTWCCYVGLLAAALLRVAAEFALGSAIGSVLMVSAALAAFAAFGAWAWRYVPMYVRPRVDAR
ncbi:MAG TPA: NnrS family protein [Burkholderiales bacterium]|nr:NnrS family protein [Burkholderiales bacterium]